jgi:hypothetical protein
LQKQEKGRSMSGMLCVASATESRRVGAGSRGRRVFFLFYFSCFFLFISFSLFLFISCFFFYLFVFLFISVFLFYFFFLFLFLFIFPYFFCFIFSFFLFILLPFHSISFTLMFGLWFIDFFNFNQYCMWVMSSVCFLLHACTPTPESSFLERHRGNLLLKRSIRAPRKHAEPRPDDSNLQRRDVKLSLKRYIVFAGQPSSMANQKSRDLCMDES